ncbi:hypothetical protein [Phytophthora cinnamomi ormycovirus 7-5]|uniref:Uncharacterized protein n=1 Tax=Phytophthora cinnamomi ormycovirus 7-5 TaxID=3239326 RepID=A0AB39JDW7_9VIRU
MAQRLENTESRRFEPGEPNQPAALGSYGEIRFQPIEKLAFILLRDEGMLKNLSSKGFYRVKTLDDGNRAFMCHIHNTGMILDACKVGPRVLERTLCELCLKESLNPGRFLNVSDSKFLVPSNLDEAADSQVHKLLILYNLLGFKMEIAEGQSAIPNFSPGWDTNVNWAFDTIHRVVCSVIREDTKETLPTHLKQDFSKILIQVIVYKWASKHNVAAYLTNEYKQRGNLSEIAMLDIMKGWGTTLAGNIAGRMASAIYQLTSIIANHPGTNEMIPRSAFLTAGAIRRRLAPPRQVVEKKGRESKLVQSGEINVLRFDNVRFLLPSERVEAKKLNEAADLEKHIREFDCLSINERDYPALELTVKNFFEKNSKTYFRLRRNARQRLYAVKEIRREAKQTDQIPDSDFSSEIFIDSVVEQAESMIVDLQRRHSIIERLRLDVFSSTGREVPSSHPVQDSH